MVIEKPKIPEIPKIFKATFLDRAMYLDRWGTNNTFHCNIDFKIHIDENILEKALRLSFDAEPIFGCKFVTDGKTAFFERRDDLNSIKLLTISQKEVFTNEEIMDFIIIDIDPIKDPFIQAKIFRTEESDFLIIKISHLPMDAGGFKEYISLLSFLYNNLINDIDYKPIPNVEGDRSLNQIIDLFEKKKIRSISRKMNGFMFWKLLYTLISFKSTPNKLGFPYSGKTNTKLNYIVRKINLTDLNAYRKKNNSTINDVLLTAFLLAIFRLLKPDKDTPIVFDVPIDLRKYLPDEKADAPANLLGGTRLKIYIDDKNSFEEILALVKEKMDKVKRESHGLGSTILMKKLGRFLQAYATNFVKKMAKKTFKSGIFIPKLSNFGILSPNNINFNNTSVIDAVIITPMNRPPRFLLGVSSFKESLYFSVGYDDAEAFTPVINEYFELLGIELKNVGVNEFITII
ncbi:MAG: hypothetical protein GY870_02315 [archaeon]|nr:hypothetical protein [archaeon]